MLMHAFKCSFDTVPSVSFTASTFVVFENQTSVGISVTRSGDMCGHAAFHIQTLPLSAEDAARGK